MSEQTDGENLDKTRTQEPIIGAAKTGRIRLAAFSRPAATELTILRKRGVEVRKQYDGVNRKIMNTRNCGKHGNENRNTYDVKVGCAHGKMVASCIG